MFKLATGWLIRMQLCVMLLGSIGCQCIHPRLNNSERLMERVDFPQAARAAPDWVGEALTTINALEYELEKQ